MIESLRTHGEECRRASKKEQMANRGKEGEKRVVGRCSLTLICLPVSRFRPLRVALHDHTAIHDSRCRETRRSLLVATQEKKTASGRTKSFGAHVSFSPSTPASAHAAS